MALGEGAYILRVETNGEGQANSGRVVIGSKETKTIDLIVSPAKTSAKPAAQVPEFFDEPQFTVAGVTQASNSGGHGSDTVQRTTEALAKATISLSKEPERNSAAAKSGKNEESSRSAVSREPESFDANLELGRLLVDSGSSAEAVPFLSKASRLNPKDPEVHHLLGTVEEQLGNPLDAVREYQFAAELDPNEQNLFAWGPELLAHRALEPATDVFTKSYTVVSKICTNAGCAGRCLVCAGLLR